MDEQANQNQTQFSITILFYFPISAIHFFNIIAIHFLSYGIRSNAISQPIRGEDQHEKVTIETKAESNECASSSRVFPLPGATELVHGMATYSYLSWLWCTQHQRCSASTNDSNGKSARDEIVNWHWFDKNTTRCHYTFAWRNHLQSNQIWNNSVCVCVCLPECVKCECVCVWQKVWIRWKQSMIMSVLEKVLRFHLIFHGPRHNCRASNRLPYKNTRWKRRTQQNINTHTQHFFNCSVTVAARQAV